MQGSQNEFSSLGSLKDLPKLYRGSVKDLLGPVATPQGAAVVFEYSDAYSVFDWGRMPDTLPRKGEALAVLASHWFEVMERAESWKEFSRTAEALSLRKGNRFGASFNEVGEKLQQSGLRTHYYGAVGPDGTPRTLQHLQTPPRAMAARHVSAVRPQLSTILGRSIPDYAPTHQAKYPRLVPLEVVFRFACPEGSSLIERLAQDPQYLVSRGFQETQVQPGHKWEFPVLEMFTKLETSDRPLSLSEALFVSGLTGAQLQDLLFRTAWVAGFLKSQCSKHGLELADGKLEWAVDEKGEIFLVDAVGPDELRILKNGVQLSKEFLRGFYRSTLWYEATSRAKSAAAAQGSTDWKRLVQTPPPALPAKHREVAAQVYLSLANRLTGKMWFPDAWDLDRVLTQLGELAQSDREGAKS